MSLLLTWGTNNGHVWDYSVAGPAGLTILHLAALLNDGGKVANELTGDFPFTPAAVIQGWTIIPLLLYNVDVSCLHACSVLAVIARLTS